MSKARSLLLIDGSSYLYRAFHALPELTNSSGAQTGAIHGVLNMLHRILTDQKPDLIAVVMDAPGKTFRDELFAEYKANRPPMPNLLREQINPLLKAIEALGLPLLQIKGVEADDVIGTLATQADAAGITTVISTGDKDMAQLVNEHITLLDTMPRGPSKKPRPLDTAGVIEKFEVRPNQIIDFLALVGDSSDNIPGVPKVGQKTAVALLAEFDGIDDILAGLDRIPELNIRGAKSVAQRIADNEDILKLSYKLATIDCNLELEQTVESLVAAAPNPQELRPLYEELELRRLLGKLDLADSDTDTPPAQPAEIIKADYELVLTQNQLNTWLKKITQAELTALDTETTSIDYMQAEIVGLSLAVTEGKACYIPVAHCYPGAPEQLNRDDVLQQLKPWLEDEKQAKVGHHLKYDAHVLANHGIELHGMAFDTMLESYILNSTATRHDMDSVAKYYLGVDTIHYEDVAGKGAKQLRFDDVELEQATPYAAEDADITLRLHNKLWPEICATGELETLYTNIEQPLVSVLESIETTGVLIDARQLAKQSQELGKQLITLEKTAYKLAGHDFNLGSPKQLQHILFEELKIPVIRKTPKGQPSTAEDVLQELAEEHELPRIILENRSLSKLKSTYTDKLPEQIAARDGRIHTSYHQAVTATGRLSSSSPNLQNIPVRTEEGRRIRQAFIAPKGCSLIAADYSQIELRIMAHISGDLGLVAAFAEDQDIHRATAAEVFNTDLEAVSTDQRRSAKAINFGLIYGMSAFGLAKQLGIPRYEAQDYVNLYFERYPGVADYMDATREQAKQDGYVKTVFGRRLYLPEINARQAQRRQYAERSAINAPMQGTAADIIKYAMLAVNKWLQANNSSARMIMQVHDELVLEASTDEAAEIAAEIAKLMNSAAQLAVPLKVDTGIGQNWDEAH
ncbi:MAG: DNA polymerase I [Gammaproteobacteria bacterium]|nr:DNA polymerase I [Gammaproteobacteria bacterium]MCP4091669.1 DNA polymerase I [Gammaproteobacteria bacterium]MCP4276165.1 DNA polymerase I [Gammaproteobacteria bacterium]MCP4831799.1 DNA polymerase I [Gammaproteobacteria bacterium]MCP4929735.1 DNA polymerase I [Gammaproteobacteria bacterium]